MKKSPTFTALLGGLVFALVSGSALAELCYDRSRQGHQLVVDSHLHFQPFSGPHLDHRRLVEYLERAGVKYANVYGIGQTRIQDWACLNGGDCSGNAVIAPTLKNDFVNGVNMNAYPRTEVQLRASMTFPDLQNPEGIVDRMAILDREFPGLFQWMGEANLVKEALFSYGHEPATLEDIANWAPFMERLAERNMPLALHSDMGNSEDDYGYVHLMEAVLEQYPDNTVVWMHLGTSREQQDLDPAEHVAVMTRMMETYPNLWFDISWNVLYDAYFRDAERRAPYVEFLNQYASRILTGTDVVASSYTGYNEYLRALEQNSFINQFLNKRAFRYIALGQSYFDLVGVDDVAPPVC
jgi:hypothetical protein